MVVPPFLTRLNLDKIFWQVWTFSMKEEFNINYFWNETFSHEIFHKTREKLSSSLSKNPSLIFCAWNVWDALYISHRTVENIVFNTRKIQTDSPQTSERELPWNEKVRLVQRDTRRCARTQVPTIKRRGIRGGIDAARESYISVRKVRSFTECMHRGTY